MMEMTDDYGHNIFETIKITLVRATHTHGHAPLPYAAPARDAGVRRLP